MSVPHTEAVVDPPAGQAYCSRVPWGDDVSTSCKLSTQPMLYPGAPHESAPSAAATQSPLTPLSQSCTHRCRMFCSSVYQRIRCRRPRARTPSAPSTTSHSVAPPPPVLHV